MNQTKMQGNKTSKKKKKGNKTSLRAVSMTRT